MMRLLQYVLLMSIIIALFTMPIYADQIATTEDGRKVILGDDGTWKHASVGDIVALKNSESKKSVKQPPAATEKKENPGEEKTSSGLSDRDISSLVNVLDNNKSLDFRGVRWGMSFEEVKKIEKLNRISEGKQSLTYDYVLIGMNCQIIYNFKENKLVSAQYKIGQKHIDPALFNEDYNAIKKHLMKVQGFPVSDKDVWKNEQYKSDKSKWGFAVSIGFLTRIAVWKKEGAKITLKMNGENHKIFIKIKYSSIKLL